MNQKTHKHSSSKKKLSIKELNGSATLASQSLLRIEQRASKQKELRKAYLESLKLEMKGCLIDSKDTAVEQKERNEAVDQKDDGYTCFDLRPIAVGDYKFDVKTNDIEIQTLTLPKEGLQMNKLTLPPDKIYGGTVANLDCEHCKRYNLHVYPIFNFPLPVCVCALSTYL